MQPTRDQLFALCDDLSVGLSVVHVPDPDDPESMRIVYANPAASRVAETDIRGVVGCLFLEAFPGLRGSQFPELYARVVREQTIISLPDIVYGDDIVPEAAFAVRLYPLPGSLVAGEYVNVTQQRQAERKLHALNTALVELVSQRTASLEASTRKLERVEHAAAHELQGPVWTIIGYLGVIRESVSQLSGDAEILKMLDRAEIAAGQLRSRIASLTSGVGALPNMSPTQRS